MIDGIIKADGTSRLMRAELPATYEEFRAQCLAGAQPLDILFNAIGWSQLPTSLNKANLLKDTTAEMFEKGKSAVPDDIFLWLAQYNQHWWRRLVPETYGYVEKKTDLNLYDNPPFLKYGSRNYSVSYSTTISVDRDTGVVSLVNPKTFSMPSGQSQGYVLQVAESLLALSPCYITGCGNGSYSGDPSSEVFYIPENATAGTSNNTATILAAKYSDSWSCVLNNNDTDSSSLVVAKKVSSEYKKLFEAGDYEYLHDSDRNAYPDSGTVDGLTYEYLGIPFQNAVTAPKIASGSYTGTGTRGSSNPNILSFGFAPKFVFVYVKSGVPYYSGGSESFNKYFVWGVGLTKGTAFYKGGSSATINFTATNDGLNWYITTAGGTTYSKAIYQFNESGVAYGYVAIG